MATVLAKTDPGLVYENRLTAGEAMRRVAKAAVWARVLRRSARYMRMCMSGDRPAPLAVVGEQVRLMAAAGFSVAPIYAYLQLCGQGGLQRMSDDELRRHTRALLKVETEAQGELDNREIDLDLNDPAQVAEAKARAIRHREAL